MVLVKDEFFRKLELMALDPYRLPDAISPVLYPGGVRGVRSNPIKKCVFYGKQEVF